MNVFTKNGSKINISKNSYAGGGEGDIYIDGKNAIKIFHTNTIKERKIVELNKINNNEVISPKEAIYNSSGDCIGYTMKFVDNAEPLSKVITTKFQNENGISINDIISMTSSLKKSFEDIHSAGCLVVDGNEMNFLVDIKSMKMILIDTDSYKTPSFNPTAISPSTLDPLANGTFSQSSDWYIYAVICTLLFIGVHPFKGRHPKYIKRDMIARMKGGASIFDENTSLPKMARDTKNVPTELREWLIEVLSNKSRRAPPDKIMSTNVLEATPIVSKVIGNKKFNLYSNAAEWGDYRIEMAPSKKDLLEVDNRPVILKISDGKLLYYDMGLKKSADTKIPAQKLIMANNRVFVVNNGMVSRIAVVITKSNIIFGADVNTPVLPYATDVFNNVIIQNVMGSIQIGTITNNFLSFKDYGVKEIVDAIQKDKSLEVWSNLNGNVVKNEFNI